MRRKARTRTMVLRGSSNGMPPYRSAEPECGYWRRDLQMDMTSDSVMSTERKIPAAMRIPAAACQSGQSCET
jgi:hypothetical protein